MKFIAALFILFPAAASAGKSHCVVELINDGDLVVLKRESGLEKFYRTNRGLSELRFDYYRSGMIDYDVLAGQRVLDAGCGGGKFVDELRTRGIEAYGVDLIIDACKIPEPYFIQGDLAKLPFPDDHFDSIYSTWSVLSYWGRHKSATPIEVVRTVIKELARTLKPGGVIHISPLAAQSRTHLLTSYFEQHGLVVSFEPLNQLLGVLVARKPGHQIVIDPPDR